MSKQITVSVIIPAHNAARFIEPCLHAALASAKGRDWEIIVVDDGSTDDTARIVESFVSSSGVRTARHERSLGAAAARNHGTRIAHGEVFVFVDSDIVLPEGTLRKLVDPLLNSTEIHATGAHASPRNLSPSWSANFVAVRHSHAFYCQPMSEMTNVSCFQSECGAVRREVFERLGGFPEKYTHAGMEDYALGHEMERLGYRSVLLADAAYDHHYRSLWPRCKEVVRRTARWLPLVFRRRKFESAGMGASSRDSLSFLISVAILVGVIGGLLHWIGWHPKGWPPIGWYLAGIAAVAQIIWEWPFLRFAGREDGPKMALYAWPALQVFHGAIFLGFIGGVCRIVAMVFERRQPVEDDELESTA